MDVMETIGSIFHTLFNGKNAEESDQHFGLGEQLISNLSNWNHNQRIFEGKAKELGDVMEGVTWPAVG